MLRLNTAIKPTQAPKPLGVIGGDLSGFPNGRRVFDDVVTIELRAIAGAPSRWSTRPTSPTRRPPLVTDGLTDSSVPSGYLDAFPVPRRPAIADSTSHRQYRTISIAFDRRGLGMRWSVLAAVFPVPRFRIRARI